MTRPNNAEYLFEIQDREQVTVRRILEAPYAFSWLWDALGIPYPFCWIGISIPRQALRGIRGGDVDLMAGPLLPSITPHERQKRVEELLRQMPRGYIRQYGNDGKLVREATDEELKERGRSFANYLLNLQLIQEGRFQWPPDFAHLVAVNVKASWYSQDDVLKSSKQGRLQKSLEQAKSLCEMGFDKVLHLDVVSTEPNQRDTSFFPNASRGADARATKRKVYETEVAKNHPFGIAVAAWSPAPPGNEAVRGGIGWDLLREIPKKNPLAESQEGREARKLVARALRRIFADAAKPGSVPVYLLQCQEKRCHRIFVTNNYMHEACWPCRIPKIRAGIEELKKGLTDLYGSQFDRLILFGSWARGQAEEGSDVDLLLVLKNSPDPSKELEKARPIITALSLKYDILFSVTPMDLDDHLKRRGTGFFAVVEKEGKLL